MKALRATVLIALLVSWVTPAAATAGGVVVSNNSECTANIEITEVFFLSMPTYYGTVPPHSQWSQRAMSVNEISVYLRAKDGAGGDKQPACNWKGDSYHSASGPLIDKTYTVTIDGSGDITIQHD